MATAPVFSTKMVGDLVSSYLESRTHSLHAYRADSRQIEELRTADFSSIKTELGKVFESDPPPVVPVNLVSRVAKELAELYVRPPRRTLSGVRAGQAAAIERVLAEVDWDSAMQLATEQAVTQNSVVLSVEPGRRVGVPLVQTWLPHQVTVTFRDPSRLSAPIQDADRVEIQVPVQVEQDEHAATVLYGHRVYTPTEAWLQTPTGDRVPLLGGAVHHGLGYIPLAAMRLEAPRDGLWLPALPYDILCVAVSQCMSISDIPHLCRYQLHTEEHWIGREAHKVAQDQPTGPSFVHGWDVSDPADLTHEVVQRNPPVEKYWGTVDKVFEWFAANRRVSRSALTESTGITGDAKAEERADQDAARLDMEKRCKRLERDGIRLLADVLRLAGEPSFAAPMVPDVSVDYHYIVPRTNRLQGAQADAILIAQDRASTVELVSRDEGLTLAEAEARVAERRARRAPVGPIDGLDRIDPDDSASGAEVE